jgi:hypothetical protein
MCAGRRCLGIVAAVGLSFSAACTHGRSHASRGLSPTPPPRHGSAASSDALRRAEDKVNSVHKQLELATRRPPESGNNPERPVGQIGTESASSASTTGVAPRPTVSGGWSSVVSETPGATAGPPASTPGQTAGPAASERRFDGPALRATIVACLLVAAIIWLPRRLHQ